MSRRQRSKSGVCWVGALLIGVTLCSCVSKQEPVVAESEFGLTKSKPCTLAVLPGTDPSKPTKTTCEKPPLKSPAPDLLAKQQAYLEEWKKLAPTWSGLSAAAKESKLRALKTSILGE